jgi:Ca2+-binding RTX toxin-like protein
MMVGRVTWRLLAATLALLLTLGSISALAASNAVPGTRLGSVSQAITVSNLAPPECASIAAGLTQIVVGSGAFDGGAASELILGSAGADTIRGRQGNDCIVGGAGNDNLQGNQGNDVLVGGADDDALDGNQNTDICYGGSGTDTAQNCETTFGVP